MDDWVSEGFGKLGIRIQWVMKSWRKILRETEARTDVDVDDK